MITSELKRGCLLVITNDMIYIIETRTMSTGFQKKQYQASAIFVFVLPDCTVLQGIAVRGKTAQENEEHTRELLSEWLTGLNQPK